MRTANVEGGKIVFRLSCIQQNSANQESRENEKQVHAAPRKPTEIDHARRQRMIGEVGEWSEETVPQKNESDRHSAYAVQGWNSIRLGCHAGILSRARAGRPGLAI